MTPKQIERIQFKIAKIRKELAADKKRWGGYYDDSRGLRYLPPELYLRIQDYSGALRYFNWFSKNFPDDSGYPVFLFEWAITLFKKDRIKEAKAKIIQIDLVNTWIVPAFLEAENSRPPTKVFSNWQMPDVAEDMGYSKHDAELADFAEWLSDFVSSGEASEGNTGNIGV
ncbi:tol-pal system YbgF family protein [Chryseobacterium sp. MDT2-18]|uniref:tetratricopeptide repeat protein n=1 Tax=Chryseobacterium sp. MDT2-18 TaxID=1259136 RepID=UPI00277D9C1E|nr:hypothetical protein [Chryseobacterium sp. MDT2-18]MDQ0477280.1 hypothetical protein [Chryseobacterium sp. MDT2-18]